MNKAKKYLIILLVILAIGLIGSSMYTVQEDEYAAVLQFGKIVRVDNTAGLKMKVPFIQSVTYIPKSIQMYDTAASDVITQDKKSMICDNYILWKVTDPVRFTQTLSASRSMAEDRAGVAAYNATKNIISSMSQDQIIESRGERLTALITNDANANMGSYGMEILKV
ncbi:MAG: protease modulator HflC, partial [Lachnospiraceae bacterium]|nr:protease modulator HflC [Lachnospiraceae bacterium]